MAPCGIRTESPIIKHSCPGTDSLGMDGITKAGLNGIQWGMASAAEAAVRVVNSFQPDSTDDATSGLVDLSRASLQVRASAAVVRTGDQLRGALLDILA